MTKEDPLVSMNTQNEHYDSTKNSSDKNFTEKLGSKIKKTIKNSSSKIKKGLDKTTAAMDDDHNKKESQDYDKSHEYNTNLTENDSEPYDINYNDPYFRNQNTSNHYQYNGVTKYDQNGNEIIKEKEEKHLSGNNNNNDYYDEFSNYTSNKNEQNADTIPNYSEIVIEDQKKNPEGSDPEYITQNLKSLNLADSNNNSTYHQISKTLESRENGYPLVSDEKNQTTIVPPPPLPPNISSVQSHDDRSGSNSESEKKPMYERAKDTAKGMMGSVIDKLTPNKKEKDGDKEENGHLKPGYFDTKEINTTLPKSKSETDTYHHVTSSYNYNQSDSLSSASSISSHKIKKEAEKIEKEKKAEKKKEKEKIKEREEANKKAEEETLLYPNMDPIPVNAANSSVINMNSLKSSQFSKVVIVAIDSSESSRYAVNWALNHFINKKDDLVVFINVRDSIPSINSDTDSKNRVASHELLKDYLKIYQDLNFSCRAIAMKGEPKVEIVRKSNELGADLLIMGNRGMGTFKKIFIGSVSEYCVNHAECPVLIVKNKPKNK